MIGRSYALFLRPKIAIAVTGAAVSQAVMVLLMTPTALAMMRCGFGEGQAADVIKWHVIAMFAPGFLTGPLIQRFGVMAIITTGLLALAAAALVAMAGLALWQFYLSLILTGQAGVLDLLAAPRCYSRRSAQPRGRLSKARMIR